MFNISFASVPPIILINASRTVQCTRNCFSSEIANLCAECEDVSHGYVFSYDVRRLQIAIIDSLVNIRLY